MEGKGREDEGGVLLRGLERNAGIGNRYQPPHVDEEANVETGGRWKLRTGERKTEGRKTKR